MVIKFELIQPALHLRPTLSSCKCVENKQPTRHEQWAGANKGNGTPKGRQRAVQRQWDRDSSNSI